MKFVRKKNLQENEEILYKPSLHWFYIIKYMVLSLPIFVVLLILWRFLELIELSFTLWGIPIGDELKQIIRYVFLSAVLGDMGVFICRILQYICVEYGVTNKRLMIKIGVLQIATVEIPFDRIENVYIIQSLVGRMFNYGTVRVSAIGGNMLAFYMVCRPYALRRKIVAILEKNKVIKLIQGEVPKIKKVKKEEDPSGYGIYVIDLKG